MGGLQTLSGQGRAVELLRRAIRAGRLHHGLLFEGPPASGKGACALALAMALNCERDPDGCGGCPSCEKISAGLHPDVLSFDMTPKGLTERVRSLVAGVGFRPHEGRARVVIFDPAEELAAQRQEAANALLKTLEEPPSATHFVLVTAEPRRLPVTVRSRCQRIRFASVDAPEDPEARAHVERLIQAMGAAEVRVRFDAAAEVGADREAAREACALLWRRLHGALLAREGLAKEGQPDPATSGSTTSLRDQPTSAILRGLAATSEAERALRGNVAPVLALEHLLLALAPCERPATSRARRA